MESALYDVQVRHHRTTPPHDVRRRLRLAYLDLDELEAATRVRRGWACHLAPVWFRRRDYLDGSDRPLKDVLEELVRTRTGQRLEGPVRMLTQLRTMGWLFNPITTYYCFDADGRTLAALVIEITNTPWHERHWYVLDGATVSGPGVSYPKDFHVSPFLPMNLDYHTRATVPGDHLALRFELSGVDDHGQQPDRLFDADLTGVRRRLDAPLRIADVGRAALQTVGVSVAIYAHAAALRREGAGFHPHPRKLVQRGSRVPLPATEHRNPS